MPNHCHNVLRSIDEWVLSSYTANCQNNYVQKNNDFGACDLWRKKFRAALSLHILVAMKAVYFLLSCMHLCIECSSWPAARVQSALESTHVLSNVLDRVDSLHSLTLRWRPPLRRPTVTRGRFRWRPPLGGSLVAHRSRLLRGSPL